MMLFGANFKRNMILCGWLQKHDARSYSSAAKLQHFLFLYQASAAAAGEHACLEDLYGYPTGPVYKTLDERYRGARSAFDQEAALQYVDFPRVVDDDLAEQMAFIVRALPEDELSEFTHKFAICAPKQDRIERGERSVPLDPADFDACDARLIAQLRSIFPIAMVRNSTIIQRPGVSFIFSNSDAAKLTYSHQEILTTIAKQGPGPMGNPLFVEVEPDGCLVID